MGDSLNPYAPPRATVIAGAYSPLGWKTTGASIGILGSVVFGLISGIGAIALPDLTREGPPQGAALVVVLLFGLCGLGALVFSLFAMIMFLVWLHSATKNVRAFGRYGLKFTPAWAVVSWFIPIVSMFAPYQSVSEIWRASEPESVGVDRTDWVTQRVPSLVGVWWGAYLVSGFIGMLGFLMPKSGPDPSASRGMATLIGTFFSAIAAVAIVSTMKQIARRQERCAAKLSL
jgi:hypothetical protein